MKTICQKICKVDEDNKFCIGCGRTLDEIREWYTADNPRKKEIMLSAKERLLIESIEVLDVDYHLREYD